MTDDKFKTRPDADVKVPRSHPRSKTWAIRHLSKFFVKPHIKSVTTAQDKAAGVARWRVFCTHRISGKAIGLVEVAGPPEALAKAALVGACRRVGLEAKFDALGAVTFEEASPPQPPQAPAP